MKIEDIKLPKGHVIVTSGHAGYQPMLVVGDDKWSGIDPSRVVLDPGCFRVVPREIVEEWRAMLKRHEEEFDAFGDRLRAMPQIHVDVSVR